MAQKNFSPGESNLPLNGRHFFGKRPVLQLLNGLLTLPPLHFLAESRGRDEFHRPSRVKNGANEGEEWKKARKNESPLFLFGFIVGK